MSVVDVWKKKKNSRGSYGIFLGGERGKVFNYSELAVLVLVGVCGLQEILNENFLSFTSPLCLASGFWEFFIIF